MFCTAHSGGRGIQGSEFVLFSVCSLRSPLYARVFIFIVVLIVTMSDSPARDVDNPSGHVTVLEQRAYIKIETLRGKSVAEINHALIEVCGEHTVDRSTISRWSQRFREGRKSSANDTRRVRKKFAANSRK